MTPTGYLASGYPPSPPTFPPPPTVSAGVELYQSYLDSGRFLIALGNHDWHDENAQAAKDYFGQQGHLGEGGQGRISAGPIELLPVESNGASCASCGGPHPDPAMQAVSPGLMEQLPTVVEALRNSPACWKMLFMHHPAYTTSESHETPNPIVEQFVQAVETQAAGKLNAVLAGHVHAFEYVRLPNDPVVFITNGKGGSTKNYEARTPHPRATRRFSEFNTGNYGFLIIDVTTGERGDPNKPSAISYRWHAVYQTDERAAPTPTGEWLNRWQTGGWIIETTTAPCEVNFNTRLQCVPTPTCGPPESLPWATEHAPPAASLGRQCPTAVAPAPSRCTIQCGPAAPGRTGC